MAIHHTRRLVVVAGLDLPLLPDVAINCTGGLAEVMTMTPR